MIRCDRASIALGGQLVVEAVSVEVQAGEAWALIGSSGAGKSLLLAAAATAVPLHAGDVLVHGRSVRREAEVVRRLVGYVPDRLPNWPGIRAAELLEIFATSAGLRGDAARQAVEKSLAMAGLSGRGRVEVGVLAAGHAKHLLIARALVHDPEVLLLDDPFTGLDPQARASVERLVDDAHLMGRTVMAAIDDARVPACFTHLAVLREGRLVAEGRNEPTAFTAGRGWRFLICCPGSGPEVAAVVGRLARDVMVVDDDTVAACIDPGRMGTHEIVASVVRAGLPVDAAGYDPPWQAQLVDSHTP
jgi:ABC-type multidrug transport system ATPase subunit